MPTRERAIRERGKKLETLLLTYHLPACDAKYIAEKAVERGLLGEEFRTRVETELVEGEIVVDVSVMLCLSCTLKGVSE